MQLTVIKIKLTKKKCITKCTLILANKSGNSLNSFYLSFNTFVVSLFFFFLFLTLIPIFIEYYLKHSVIVVAFDIILLLFYFLF